MDEKEGGDKQILNGNIQELEPKITERRLWNLGYVFSAFFIGVIFAIIELVAVAKFEITNYQAVILGAFLILIYAIILYFLLEPKLLREVNQGYVQTVEKPIIKEVIKTIEKPIVKEVYVEKPVVKEIVTTIEKPIVREIDRPIYLPSPKRNLNIKKFAFIGSSETKTYHKHGCRFSKLIKRKYKVSNDSATYFKSRGFAPCEYCLKKRK